MEILLPVSPGSPFRGAGRAWVGVPARGEVREGEPAREFVAAAGSSDLLVSAAASHFAPDQEDAPGRLVLAVMKEGGTPVLLSGAPYRPVRPGGGRWGGGGRAGRGGGGRGRGA